MNVTILAAAAAVLGSGCAHHLAARSTGPTVEMAIDIGAPSERPLTPNKTFETLLRFDPQLPSYRLRQLRLLLAQAGQMTITVYAAADDWPGTVLATVERNYGPALCSDGKDGKWILEDLSGFEPTQGQLKGPLWIGISSNGGGDPRLWATSNDSGSAFSRDADPSTPLSAGRMPRTPMVRVELSPLP